MTPREVVVDTGSFSITGQRTHHHSSRQAHLCHHIHRNTKFTGVPQHKQGITEEKTQLFGRPKIAASFLKLDYQNFNVICKKKKLHLKRSSYLALFESMTK